MKSENYIDPIQEYRRAVVDANEELLFKLKKFDSLKTLASVTQIEPLEKKFQEVMEKKEELNNCLWEFDDLLYRYQKLINDYMKFD